MSVKRNKDSPSSPGKFYLESKIIKLRTHPRNFSDEDLIVNFESFAKDKFQLWEGTVIEIFPLDDRLSNERRSHLILEVKDVSLDVQAKGGPLSISQEVAQAFNLNGLREVCIRRVDKQVVALDLVEFRFKDQALNRSDMWRFTNSLIGKGMYVSRKLQFAGMLLRVSGLWAQGDKVMSGAVVDTTRVVFRSSSSQMFLFLQVSFETWEFDPNGDLYFDKGVDGFLKDLFSQWKEKKCNHEVTLVLFARKYYQSQDTTDGREKHIIQQDICGRWYQDYYKVIVQRESRDDWSSAIIEVKKNFQTFQQVLKPGINTSHLIYEGDNIDEEQDEWISTAAEGNVLEAINLAINVFESQHKDCSFNTTGQQIVLISPGVGVFEVDHELSRLTKERIIDHGIGIDLICLNEQPLHAVPLFKYYHGLTLPEEHYHIPYWINYSFYNPPRPWTKYRFQPRVKISDHLVNKHLKIRMAPRSSLKNVPNEQLTKQDPSPLLDPNDPLSRMDYDEYDANIFTSRPTTASTTFRKTYSFNEDIVDGPESYSEDVEAFEMKSPLEPRASPVFNIVEKRELKQRPSKESVLSTSLGRGGRIPRTRYFSDNYENQGLEDGVMKKVGSAENVHPLSGHATTGTPVFRRKKSFINPFDPTKVHNEKNSHLCRWMHTFPRDSSGRAFQTHHVVKKLEPVDENNEFKMDSDNRSIPSLDTTSSDHQTSESLPNENSSTSLVSVGGTVSPLKKTVVENFASVRRAGMDWTSLTEPACLPITTDYYPDESSISRDYLYYPSSLVVNNLNESSKSSKVTNGWRANHQNMTTYQAFKEMISQRLSQGFQLVFHNGSLFTLHKDLADLENKRRKPKKVEVKFSLGRVFQTIDLVYPDMSTHVYRSKTSLGVKPFVYHYKLVSSNDPSDDGHVTSCTIGHQRPEGYNWNYLDQHVCGHDEFEIYQESHKYWRCRMLVLPSTPPPHDSPCEERNKWSLDKINGFVRLLELFNNIKRGHNGSGQNKKEFNRLHSLPSWSLSSQQTWSLSSQQTWSISSQQSSPCPSPSPTPPRRKSSDSDYPNDIRSQSVTPIRSITSPAMTMSAPRPPKYGSKTQGIRKAKSREDVSMGHHIRERDRQPYLSPSDLESKSPQQSLSSRFLRRRNSQEVIKDLKVLTVPSGRRAVSPNPQKRKWSNKTNSTENLQTSVEEDDNDSGSLHPPLLVPPPPNTSSSHYDYQEGEEDLENPIDYSTLEEDTQLTIDSPLHLILQALLNKDDGIDIMNQPSLKTKCFISMEAVKWLQEKLDGEPTRKDIVKTMQKMIKNGLLLHASGDHRIPFIDGYYFYYAPEYQSLPQPLQEEEDWDSFRKKWFEVAIIHPLDILSQSSGTESVSTSSHASSFQSSPYYMHHEEQVKIPNDIFSRYVEYNPDLHGLSDRPEWCYIQYDHTYNPTQGYELEFQWMACTISLLHKSIQNWAHKAAMCGFNIVPVHSLGTLGLVDSTIDTPHPFLRPVFLPLELPQEFRNHLEKSNEDSSTSLMYLFQAIVDKFGFLVDPSSVSTDIDLSDITWKPHLNHFLSHVFIHHSGCALLQPVYDSQRRTGASPYKEGGLESKFECGFKWFCNSYYLRQKSTEQSILLKYEELVERFSYFCTTCNGELAVLCNKILQTV